MAHMEHGLVFVYSGWFHSYSYMESFNSSFGSCSVATQHPFFSIIVTTHFLEPQAIQHNSI